MVRSQAAFALQFEGYAWEPGNMTIATKVAALLTALRRQDVEVLPPAERHRLADLCRYVAALAEPPAKPERSGVRCDLKTGRTE